MASLPPYETLVRWTVVDTTRWLAENGLNDFKDSFKKDGVDGSKLARLTDTDIDAYRVSSTKKRIILKNAVAAIDRSRVNSLPKTQGMMNMFRRESEPAVPPRHSRPAMPLPREPEADPPMNHAPPPPSNHHHHHNSHQDDEDNEDAYSWGEDFNDDYQSDSGPEDDYENQQEWKQDHNSNNIEMNRIPDDEDFYEEPTHPPSPGGNDGGILQKLQRELTLRRTAQTDNHRPAHNHAPAAGGGDSDSDFSDYEQPIPTPEDAPPPSVPPRPGGGASKPPPRGRHKPPPQVPPVETPPPRPPKRNPAPPPVDDDDEVYDEPDEKPPPSSRRQPQPPPDPRRLPPVPALPSPDKEERSLPPTPKGRSKGANRKPAPPPVQPPPQEQEVYEQMDPGPVQSGYTSLDSMSTEPKPQKDKRQVQRTSSRPLPSVPSKKDTQAIKKPSMKVAKVPPPPLKDELENYDWYHKNIERVNAENALIGHAEDGMYLIRKSRRGGTEQQYTLTIYKQSRVYNLPIRKREKDGKFALGAPKPNELDFESVPELVEYFQTKLIMLNPKAKSAAGSTKLMYAMPK